MKKALLVISMLALSAPAFASQGFMEEIHDMPIGNPDSPEVCHVQVSVTNLSALPQGHLSYLLKATSGTEWTGAQAQFTNVQEISLQLNDKVDAADVTIYQVDGNSMGAVKSTLHLSCTKTVDSSNEPQLESVDCETILQNGNRLALVMDL
jgi:hypothetical protein